MAAYAIQFRRGTTTEHNTFTGLLGEVTVDTTKKSLVVHDGSTAGGFALALDGAATSTTTGTFSSNVTVGGTLGVTSTSTFGGDMTITGDILPSANITYDLGSSTMMWKDIYVGPGSLYVNGKKVIEDDSGAINITTDVNEDLKLTTTGTGTLKLISNNGINLTGELGATSGDLQIGDHMDMNSNLIKEVATPVSTTDAANKAYVDSAASSAVTGGSNAVSGTTGTFSGAVTVAGNLTVSGTTTTINTAQINIADNILVLNSDATGTASVNAGFEVERGDDTNVSILWNETDDRWTVAGFDFMADTFIGNLTGNVTGSVTGNTAGVHTGDVTGNLTGDVTGDVTGNLTGNVTGNTSGSAGTVTSISAHLVDEDSMGSDSATKVPSQQSVKAYVDSQVASKDNTDEITEGSTNLYFTNARARTAISVSGDITYNSTTGVISTTGLASSDTDDLSEGSTNLYFTNARADARTAVSTAANTTAWEAHSDASEAAAISTAASTAESKDVARMVTSDAYADASEAAAIASAESKDVARMVTSDAYADASEAAAIATAAASAESKDVARMVTSDAYADASEAAAIAAAESKDVSRASTAVSNIATAKSEAIASASSDATTKADAAQAAAIASAEAKDVVRAATAAAYTDSEITALIGGAPGALDTLNELAAAINDDASYSAGIVTQLAAKLALAGGTMSGDINMGGNDITNAVNMTATNFNGTATYALYADLAERYAADAPYEEGTVVMFGGEAEVTSATGYGSTKIAGVVSTKPAFAMNSEAGNSETHPYIALQGRVPVKVIGPVSKGDILVASELSGVATVWLDTDTDPRMTAYIGIAIEDKSADTVGYVEVKVGK